MVERVHRPNGGYEDTPPARDSRLEPTDSEPGSDARRQRRPGHAGARSRRSTRPTGAKTGHDLRGQSTVPTPRAPLARPAPGPRATSTPAPRGGELRKVVIPASRPAPAWHSPTPSASSPGRAATRAAPPPYFSTDFRRRPGPERPPRADRLSREPRHPLRCCARREPPARWWEEPGGTAPGQQRRPVSSSSTASTTAAMTALSRGHRSSHSGLALVTGPTSSGSNRAAVVVLPGQTLSFHRRQPEQTATRARAPAPPAPASCSRSGDDRSGSRGNFAARAWTTPCVFQTALSRMHADHARRRRRGAVSRPLWLGSQSPNNRLTESGARG